MALLDARGFSAADFAHMHPRGGLPDQARVQHAFLRVRAVMRTGDEIPRIGSGATLREAVAEMSRGRMGMTAILDPTGKVKGVFTDGDLRRALDRNTDIQKSRMSDVMTRNPRAIGPGELAAEAVLMMEKHAINGLLVLDESGRLAGALNVHDLLRAGVM